MEIPDYDGSAAKEALKDSSRQETLTGNLLAKH